MAADYSAANFGGMNMKSLRSVGILGLFALALLSGEAEAGAVSTGSSVGKGSISVKTSERPTDFHTRRLDSFLGHLRQDLALQ